MGIKHDRLEKVISKLKKARIKNDIDIAPAEIPQEKAEDTEIADNFKILKRRSSKGKKKKPAAPKTSITPALIREMNEISSSIGKLIEAIQEDMVSFRMKFTPELPSEALYLSELEKHRENLISIYREISDGLQKRDVKILESYFESAKKGKDDLDLVEAIAIKSQEPSENLQKLKTTVLGFLNKTEKKTSLTKAIKEVKKNIKEIAEINDSEYEKIAPKTKLVTDIYGKMKEAIEEYKKGLNCLEKFSKTQSTENLTCGLYILRKAENEIQRLLSGR